MLNKKILNYILLIIMISAVTQFSSAESIEETAQKIYTSDKLLIAQSTTSTLNIPPGITEANTFISFVPKTDFRQAVLEQTTTPTATQLGDVLNFEWIRPSAGSQSFLIETKVRTSNEYLPIYDKVFYPFDKATIPDDYAVYLAESENIDINNEIREQARILAGEEDDTYIIAHNVANWIEQHIQYDLTTVTADVAKSASWTLDNKIGVCDELTSLFIAMMRSLGIPARFVAGMSYTNSPLFEKPWGPHAWAEVYFPGYGWVPFDITYRQFGHIDASHIALKTSTDADQSFTRYTWKGSGNKVTMDPLTFTTNVEAFLGTAKQQVDLSVNMLHDEVDLTSSNGVVINMKNKFAHYTSVYIQTITPQEIDIPKYEIVLLKPLEEKSLTYSFSLNGLHEQYIYTMPVEVKSLYGEQANTEFTVAKKNQHYNKGIIEDQLQSLQQEGASTYTYNCVVEPYAIAGQPLQFTCQVGVTSGNTRQVEVCLVETCSSVQLGQGIKQQIETTMQYDTPGTYTVPLTFSVLQQGKKVYNVPLVIHGEPKMDIAVNFPETISYKGEKSIDIIISPVSGSQPQNIVVYQYTGIDPVIFNIPLLDKTFKLSTTIKGNELMPGENEVETKVAYQDLAGNTYSQTSTHTIILENPTAIQKVQLYLKRWLRTLFS